MSHSYLATTASLVTTSLAAPADLTATRHDDGTLVVTMGGDWLLSGALPSPDALVDQLRTGANRLAFDTTALADWDTAALSFVLRLSGTARNASVQVDTSGLPVGLQRLLRLAEAVPEKADARSDEEEYGVVDWIGLTTLSAKSSAGETLEVLGQSVIAVGRFVMGRARYRRSDLLLLLQQAGIAWPTEGDQQDAPAQSIPIDRSRSPRFQRSIRYF